MNLILKARSLSPLNPLQLNSTILILAQTQIVFSLFDASNLCSFYNETQFNDLCVSVHPNIFCTFHLNIISLSSNYDKFIHNLSAFKHDFSVIALSETLPTEDSREIFKLPKYSLVHYTRENIICFFRALWCLYEENNAEFAYQNCTRVTSFSFN